MQGNEQELEESRVIIWKITNALCENLGDSAEPFWKFIGEKRKNDENLEVLYQKYQELSSNLEFALGKRMALYKSEDELLEQKKAVSDKYQEGALSLICEEIEQLDKDRELLLKAETELENYCRSIDGAEFVEQKHLGILIFHENCKKIIDAEDLSLIIGSVEEWPT